jgi:hypothetical protein
MVLIGTVQILRHKVALIALPIKIRTKGNECFVNKMNAKNFLKPTAFKLVIQANNITEEGLQQIKRQFMSVTCNFLNNCQTKKLTDAEPSKNTRRVWATGSFLKYCAQLFCLKNISKKFFHCDDVL